jgi:hypothetical protein
MLKHDPTEHGVFIPDPAPWVIRSTVPAGISAIPGAVVESHALLQVAGSAELLQEPFAVLQTSVVQTLLSPQFLGAPLQMPVTQTSFTVQGLLSLHAAPEAAVNLHAPVLAVQVSVVQGLLSSQTLVVPPVQAPEEQVEPVMHLLTLVHAIPFARGVWPQAPVLGSQVSVVQGLASLQRVAASEHGFTMAVIVPARWR